METACHHKRGNCRRLAAKKTPYPRRGKNCRRPAAGNAGVHRREQEGTGHHMVSCPLLTPLTFLCAATPFGRAAKRGLRGLGSVRRVDFGTLLCPEFTLRDWQRCQCAARRCRAAAFCCEKLRFHQGLCLGAPDVTVGPSHLDARPKGVASKGGFGGVKRGQGNHTVPLPPFVSAGRPRQSPRRRAAAMPGLPIGSHSRLQRQAAVSAEGLPSTDRKIFIPVLRGG